MTILLCPARGCMTSRCTSKTLISPPHSCSIRFASLSAIHNGLRKSDRFPVRPARQDASQPSTLRVSPDIAAQIRGTEAFDEDVQGTLPSASMRRSRGARTMPDFRIRRGKKDVTMPLQPPAPSRQRRFYDPEMRFGRTSAVYQLKTGGLHAELKDLEMKKRITSSFSPTPRPTRDRGRPLRDPDNESVFANRIPVFQQRRARVASQDGDEPFRSLDREPVSRSRPGARDSFIRASDSRPDTRPTRSNKEEKQPVSIPYTTAASQFLYGKSVVEAALRTARRQLYKLYIYGGSQRQNVSRDKVIETMARNRGVKTVTLGEEGLRLMDKMSDGRPHNGFVLEASPLPQLPVSGLGGPSERAGEAGYELELKHQSAEEAAVNGTDGFLSAPSSTHKPLVLLLDQVLDPGNLGAILRTASFLGVNAVAVTKHSSASMTAAALKASSGASEAMQLFSIESAAGFLVQSRKNGWQVYASVPASSTSARRKQLDVQEVEDSDPLRTDPCILILGSEGEGLTKLLRDKSDFEVNIPSLSRSNLVDSLNVSVAAGLLCSAFLRGRTSAVLQKTKQQAKLESGPSLW